MSPKVPPRDQIDAWLARAERDLEIAEANLEMGFADACAMYSQQAAEKFLKALYMLEERAEAPRTHNIVLLARQLGAAPELADSLHDLEQDYMRTRYPDVAAMAGAAEHDAAAGAERLAQARRVREWVMEQFARDEREQEHGC